MERNRRTIKHMEWKKWKGACAVACAAASHARMFPHESATTPWIIFIPIRAVSGENWSPFPHRNAPHRTEDKPDSDSEKTLIFDASGELIGNNSRKSLTFTASTFLPFFFCFPSIFHFVLHLFYYCFFHFVPVAQLFRQFAIRHKGE